MLAFISSRYQYGPFLLLFFVAEVMSNYLTTDVLKIFFSTPGAPPPLRPEARGICHICHMVNPALGAGQRTHGTTFPALKVTSRRQHRGRSLRSNTKRLKAAHTLLPSVGFPVVGSQPAGDVSHKPGGRLPLLSARPAVTLATLKRAAISFAAW